ncbi:ABC transporter ATP-binding protein [Paludibaculum fermentans]|uniref:ABC transporter ATP-binding protein n=1 Tax=Paludibaculum fermentans TaxID=1473598 RepID=A0A7S7NMX4_PALFE|nr:ABC transporter ATP-binding protein [Paludibaculum fermentans]QOY86551.1 ABC transporter ATP-binding protein [Paludibaculum fermentans]
MIRIDKVTRRFGPLEAVKDLSLDIAEGEIFGLVGPDGAGKTTTLRMLVGLMDPTQGSLSVAGLDVGKNLDAVKDQIGYMAQKFGLYGDLTVEENMFFYSDLFGIDHAERDRMMAEFLDMTRMTPFRQRPAAKLSGGMKQKLALMCTLLHRPRVLFLDEPTNGVDPLSRRDFWEILYRLASEGMTILVSTAYLDEAERCSRVGLMHKGRLIRCDKPAILKQQLAPQCFRAESADLRAARGRLQNTPGVLGAEPAGAALHVYLEAGTAAADVERAAGDVRLNPLDPALEDVFIALIRTEERHAAA